MTDQLDLDALERLAKAVDCETCGVDDGAEWVACAPQYVLALLARLRAAEQRIEEQLETQQAMKESNDANYDRWEQAASERDALQARVTAFEALTIHAIRESENIGRQVDCKQAVDLAAFLNVTGEAVADALQAAGCRLEVVRDPGAPTL